MKQEENIFKNTYFGKPYKTRDGRKAIYHMFHGAFHELILPDGILLCNNDGTSRHGETNRDIASEWTISEEELERLAAEESLWLADAPLQERRFKEGFKAGYRKAIEE